MVPKCVIDKTIKHIAFYQTKAFKEDPCCIRWYGEVKKVSIVKRKELLPDTSLDPKAENDYYKIEFDKLHARRIPIISHRPRRILFIPTTLWHFQHAKEINEVFYESPLEERFWEIMRDEQINAERQFIETTNKGTFYLDFALFCKERNIDIECDGDTFHLDEKDVKRDKKRNNILESMGWSVLRYTTEEITRNLGDVITQVKKAVNRNGGIQDTTSSTAYKYLDEGSPQLRLFDF
jgi:very-short-patch-repair endonuclease